MSPCLSSWRCRSVLHDADVYLEFVFILLNITKHQHHPDICQISNVLAGYRDQLSDIYKNTSTTSNWDQCYHNSLILHCLNVLEA